MANKHSVDRRRLLTSAAGSALWLSTQRGAVANTLSNSRTGAIRDIRVGMPTAVPDNFGDTWVTAWADDDNLYAPANDAFGFGIPPWFDELARLHRSDWGDFIPAAHKKQFDRLMGPINFNRVTGNDPLNLRGSSVNRMDAFVALDQGPAKADGTWAGPPDGRSWKSSGCTFIDGTLYWVVARHKYPGSVDVVGLRQEAAHASIIKSTDYGRSWSRSPADTLNAPMFPGSHFSTPYFVDYGRAHLSVDGADRYVYAISNNGYWDNGDTLILGRVPRTRIASLDGSDWQFFTGGNGSLDASWTVDPAAARPIVENHGKLAETGAVYLPARQRYMMIGWYYPGGSGYFKGASTTTVWDFYEAPKPWGPWTKIHSHTWSPQGYYCPGICPKFQSADRVYVTTAGDFNNWWDYYHLTLVPIDLT